MLCLPSRLTHKHAPFLSPSVSLRPQLPILTVLLWFPQWSHRDLQLCSGLTESWGLAMAHSWVLTLGSSPHRALEPGSSLTVCWACISSKSTRAWHWLPQGEEVWQQPDKVPQICSSPHRVMLLAESTKFPFFCSSGSSIPWSGCGILLPSWGRCQSLHWNGMEWSWSWSRSWGWCQSYAWQ